MDALSTIPLFLERYDQANGLVSLRLLRLFRVFQLLRMGQCKWKKSHLLSTIMSKWLFELTLLYLHIFKPFCLLILQNSICCPQDNVTFLCLTNVMAKSLLCLKLLVIVLVFGAAFFGSMLYWLEKGGRICCDQYLSLDNFFPLLPFWPQFTDPNRNLLAMFLFAPTLFARLRSCKGDWKYTELTDPPSFAYVRSGIDGVSEEISPFPSIPSTFWWFMVTATTVGYGGMFAQLSQLSYNV